MCRKMRGFTLLELIIVVMIVALLMSLIIPMYASYQNRLAVQNSAQMIVTDLTHMRQKAISLERLAGIKINSDLYTYYTFWDQPVETSSFADTDLKPTPAPSPAPRTYKDVNLKELFQTTVQLQANGSSAVIYFDPTTTDGTYWSIVTPRTGSETSTTRWDTPVGGSRALMTVQSGNYTSTVWLSREGVPAVSTPAP